MTCDLQKKPAANVTCYGLPVRLPYIVVTCARMFRIKRPPCRLGVFSDILSVHDNFGNEDRDLKGYFTVKK